MLNSIVDFYLNKTVKISSKVLTFLLIVVCVCFIDNITGYSFYKNNHEKITQLKMLSELKHNNYLNNESEALLLEIEKNIITRKNIKDRFNETIESIVQTNFVEKDGVNVQPRNNLKLFLLTNWFALTLALIFTVALLMSGGREGIEMKNIAIHIILTLFSIFIISIISYYLISKIPMIGNSWKVNYILSFFIQPIIIVGLFFLLGDLKMEKTQRPKISEE